MSRVGAESAFSEPAGAQIYANRAVIPSIARYSLSRATIRAAIGPRIFPGTMLRAGEARTTCFFRSPACMADASALRPTGRA
jgi:hypothetical protein